MKIIQGSRVPKDPTYFHLAYTAATVPIPSPHQALLAAGVFLFGCGIFLARKGKPLVFLGRTFSGIFGILAGFGFLMAVNAIINPESAFAHSGPVVFLIVFGIATGFLSFRGLRAAIIGFPSDPPSSDATEKTFESKYFAGKALMVIGLGAFSAAFLFGKPNYMHPDWMTHSNMRVIADRVENAIKTTITEEQWLLRKFPFTNDQLARNALEEAKKVESRFLDDGWNQPMKAGPAREKDGIFELVSAGPDGVPATADDVIGTVTWGRYGSWSVTVVSKN